MTIPGTEQMSLIDQLHAEFQVSMQLMVHAYTTELTDAGEKFVGTVLIDEIAGLLGDTIWRVMQDVTDEDLNTRSLTREMVEGALFNSAAATAQDAFRQLKQGTAVIV